MKFIFKLAAGAATCAVLMLGTLPGAAAQAVSTVPSVDLNRLTGNWYEIARLPNKRQRGCLANVEYLVALADKADHLQLVSTCKTKNDYTDVANANIKAEKHSNGSKLKVTYFWPFSEKGWVLALGPDYDWALIGSPNHKKLKILSRSRTLSDEVLAGVKQNAASEGYALDKLAMTLQIGR